MSRKEFEIFCSILDDMDASDDKIEVLERLHFVIKNMVNEYVKQKCASFPSAKTPERSSQCAVM